MNCRNCGMPLVPEVQAGRDWHITTFGCKDALQKRVAELESVIATLLSDDLTIPISAHIISEFTVKARVLSVGKWTPPILDPEGFESLE